jgi:hypothetical protein
VLPAFAFFGAAVLRAFGGGVRPLVFVADVLPSAAAAIAISPLALFLPALFGARAVTASAALFALVLTPAAAAAIDGGTPRRFLPGLAALALAVLLALVQVPLPQASPSSPERLSFAYHEGAGQARWLAESERGALPPSVKGQEPFSRGKAPVFPWTPGVDAFIAPAPALGIPPPRVEVVSSEREGRSRRLRLRVSSPRGAPVVSLVLPPSAGLSGASVEGIRLEEPSARLRRYLRGYRVITCMTTPPGGFLAELELEGDPPVEIFAWDRSPGLPSRGAALAAARPATAVPSRTGDETFATWRGKL